MIEGKTRITTIRLDAEADRKSRLMAEFYDKPLSEIYRDGIQVLYEECFLNNITDEVINFEAQLTDRGFIANDETYNAVSLTNGDRLNQAAVEISAQLSKIPNTPENQDIINQGTRLVHLLTIN
jgi:hypothetical protein